MLTNRMEPFYVKIPASQADVGHLEYHFSNGYFNLNK